MKQYLKVRGSQETVLNLEVNVDTVYIRDNIQRIETEMFTGWEYDEIQYSLREYQELVGFKTNLLTDDVNDVAEMVALTVEDTSSIAELLAYLIEENSNLKSRIEILEKRGVLND